MKEIYKVGDRVLARQLIGGYFHAHIIVVGKGLFGVFYIARWKVNSDFGGEYETCGKLYKRNILMKN